METKGKSVTYNCTKCKSIFYQIRITRSITNQSQLCAYLINYYFPRNLPSLCALWRNMPQLARSSSFPKLHDHTQTEHFHQDSSVGVTSPTHTHYLTTRNIRKGQPCHRSDSKPQSQQASRRRLTPQSALWPGSAVQLF